MSIDSVLGKNKVILLFDFANFCLMYTVNNPRLVTPPQVFSNLKMPKKLYQKFSNYVIISVSLAPWLITMMITILTSF